MPKPNNDIDSKQLQALASVTQWPSSLLNSRASLVNDSENFEETARRMQKIMADAQGVGLAANQIGLLKQLLVFQSSPDMKPETLINPKITCSSEKTAIEEESCLSLPLLTLPIRRPKFCVITALNLKGEKLTIEASGYEARILQHEIDHLNGLLIIDRVDKSLRKQALKLLRQQTSRNG